MFYASLIPVYGPKLANWSLPRDSVTSYIFIYKCNK